jgi:hypothetical protein
MKAGSLLRPMCESSTASKGSEYRGCENPPQLKGIFPYDEKNFPAPRGSATCSSSLFGIDNTAERKLKFLGFDCDRGIQKPQTDETLLCVRHNQKIKETGSKPAHVGSLAFNLQYGKGRERHK